jgi:filamentous hemagglutinin family protein
LAIQLKIFSLRGYSEGMIKRILPIFFLSTAFGLPTGMQVEQKSAEIIATDEARLSIRADDRSIVNWTDFSIGKEESVKFLLPDSSSWILNRVGLGGPSSVIDGSLTSNGQVLLINPNGVIVGKEGSIQMQSFIASTLDLHNDLFNDNWVFEGVSEEKILHYGNISVQKDLFFIGRTIESEGPISSLGGECIFASASTFAKDRAGPWTKGSFVKLSSMVENPGGSIAVLGQTIFIDEGARLDASGGRIDIGGRNSLFPAEQTVVAASAILSVNALSAGDGGSISVWSDQRTVFAGRAEAMGGSVSGDGGWIDVSGGWINFQGHVDTRAPFGKTGEFLLDPIDIEVGTAADMNITVVPGLITPTMPPSSVSQATVNAALGASNVTIQSSGGAGGEQGNIFLVIDYPILPVPLSTNTLTLDSFHDILINATLAYLGPNSGSLVLNALSGDIVVGNAATPTPQTTNAIVRTDGGALQMTARNIFVQGNPAGPYFAQVNSFRNGTTTIRATTGDVQVLAGNADGAYAQIGADSLPVGFFSDIFVDSAQDVIVTGAPFTNSFAIIGHGQRPVIKPDTFTGDISVIAGGDVLLTGGLSPVQNGFAVIGHQGGDTGFSVSVFGDVSVVADGSITLLGGSNESFARIGHGSLTYNNATVSGNVNVFAQGPITMTGGTNSSAAHIGHFSLGAGSIGFTTILSDLMRVQSNTSITLTPGTGGSTAIIGGRSNGGGAATSINITDISVFSAGNILINPSLTVGGIGHIAGNLNATNGSILVDVLGDLTMNNIGGIAGAAITNRAFLGGVSNPATTVVINARNVFVASNTSSTGIVSSGVLTMRITNDILLTGTPPLGIIFVGAVNGMDIIAGRNIVISSGVTSATGTAGIGGGAFFPMNLSGTVRAGQDILLLDTSGAATNFSSYIASSGAGTLDVIAGRNMVISDRCLVAAIDQLSLVVDDQFPTPPFIGPGSFQLLSGGTVRLTALDNLRVFTARQNQNTILGTFISGGIPAGFSPGPLYANVPPELWGVYFFNPFFYNGEVFTIFYKDSLQLAAQQAMVIVDQFLVDLHPYNEFPGWLAEFALEGEDVHEKYRLRRRQLSLLNHPKSWTVWLNN